MLTYTVRSDSATSRAWRSTSSIFGLRVMMPARHSPVACGVASDSPPLSRTAAATFPPIPLRRKLYGFGSIYGAGGIVIPFVGIKLIDMLITSVGLA